MTLSAAATDRPLPAFGEAGAAFLATLLFVALHAAGGFATLADAGSDNDSLLRLVEVRDLIAGQGWFDLHQYRLRPEGGLPMHWSRLVDAPVAAIVLAASAVTGSPELGETVALVLWPALLFFAALYFLLRSARRFAGPSTLLPVLLIGATALHYTAVFAPGAIDHHNLQVVLALGTLAFLLDAAGKDGAFAGATAGACSALLLAVAMEGVPYVAAAGIVVALSWLADPAAARRTAPSFGLAFAGVCAAAFVATVPYGSWPSAVCDAYSLPQLSLALLSGLGLSAIAASPFGKSSFTLRLAALGALGALVAVAAVSFFPQCLADPYAGLDPRIRSWWLDAVTEAQPFWKILSLQPAMAAGHYATPLLGLLCLAAAVRRFGPRREVLAIAAFLGAAFLVSVWQVRGSVFAIPLAAVPLGGFVAEWRLRASRATGTATTLKMAGAWLVSFSVVWSAVAGGLAGLFQHSAAPPATASAAPLGACSASADFARLAAMPAGTVLTVSNLGARVLKETQHRVLAGPYHRNVEGNLAALDAFAGSPAAAREIVRRHRVTLVALCPGNDESRVFVSRAPQGLLAMLLGGETPVWLQPVLGSEDEALQLFRVALQD